MNDKPLFAKGGLPTGQTDEGVRDILDNGFLTVSQDVTDRANFMQKFKMLMWACCREVTTDDGRKVATMPHEQTLDQIAFELYEYVKKL